MSTWWVIWWVIAALALGSLALKATGPLLAGGRTPPPAVTRVVALLAPALVTALVVAGTLTVQQDVVVDARLAGVAVGAAALWCRVPVVLALLLAALAAATVRGLA